MNNPKAKSYLDDFQKEKIKNQIAIIGGTGGTGGIDKDKLDPPTNGT